MSAPVILAVVLNMQVALQGITKATGYFNDVQASSVVLDPVPLDTVPATEVPFLLVGHRVEPVQRSFVTSRPVAIRDTWRITIEARIDALTAETDRKITAIHQLVADVETALLSDFGNAPGWGLTRNFIAMDTRIQQATPYVGLANQTMCFVEIPVDILMQRQYGKP